MEEVMSFEETMRLNQELYEAKRDAIMYKLRTFKLQKEIDDLKKTGGIKYSDNLIYLALGTESTIRSYLPSAIDTGEYDEATLMRIAHYCFVYYSDPVNIMVMLDGQTKKNDTITRIIEIMVREWWKGNCEKFQQKHER